MTRHMDATIVETGPDELELCIDGAVGRRLVSWCERWGLDWVSFSEAVILEATTSEDAGALLERMAKRHEFLNPPEDVPTRR